MLFRSQSWEFGFSNPSAQCCGFLTQDPDMTDPDFLKYGYLYNWFAAMPQAVNNAGTNECSSLQGDYICPVSEDNADAPDWHLPDNEEWIVMERYLCETYTAADAAQCAIDFPYGNNSNIGYFGTVEGGILKEPGYDDDGTGEWWWHADAGDEDRKSVV